MAMRAETIEQVIDIMDGIMEECVAKNNRLGFFTALYRATTIVVKERCDAGNFFEDNDRMRKLDVIFANRYFESYEAYVNKGTPTKSWAISFQMAENTSLMILQHMLMGMNAHISLDLGISAAEISDGSLSPSLERDFFRLNNLLAGLIDTVQDEIAEVSPLLKYMDMLGGRFDESFVSYSINYARDRAWSFAQELAPLTPEERQPLIAARDELVSGFSQRVIANLRFPLGLFIRFVKMRESTDTRHILQVISNETWNTNVRNRVYMLLRKVEEQGLDLSKRDTQLIRIPKELTT